MPLNLSSPTTQGADLAHAILKELLRPSGGYTGDLVIRQFWIGLVPGLIQQQFTAQGYGSLNDMGGRRPLERTSPTIAPFEDSEDLNEQRVQFSVWNAQRPVAYGVIDKIRNEIRAQRLATPVRFSAHGLIVSDFRLEAPQAIQEDDKTWHAFAEFVLTIQE